jgi:hypothetical protein
MFVLADLKCYAKVKQPGPVTAVSIKLIDQPLCCRILLNSVEAAIKLNILAYQKGQDMWDYIYSTYSGINTARKYEGVKALASFKYGPGSVSYNFERSQKLVMSTRFAAGKDTVSFNELAVAMLLNSLPARFNATRAILESTGSEVSMQLAQNALTAEEQRKNLRDVNNVAATATTATPGNCTVSNIPLANCWHCHPELSPKNQLCKDCCTKGHKPSKNARCSKHVPNGKRIAESHFSQMMTLMRYCDQSSKGH